MLKSPSNFNWQNSAKISLDGTYRSRSLEESWNWLSPLAQAAGVTRVANVTGLDLLGIPVWTSVRPNSRGLSVSQGKGVTDAAARISALMESIENWHAEEIELPVRMSDYPTLQLSEQVADPARLSQNADVQYRADLTLPWVEGFELSEGQPCWVPFECVSTDYTVPSSSSAPLSTFVQSSNGLAGGNSHWEACSHGMAEVIERHAIAANQSEIRNFEPGIRLNLGTVTDPHCREILQLFENAGLVVAIFMLPSDLDRTGSELPVAACSIIDADGTSRWRNLPPFNGYGCHLDSSIALSRALTEAAQSRLTYISGGRDDIMHQEYRRGGHPDDLDVYRAMLEKNGAHLDFGDFRRDTSDSFQEDCSIMAGFLRDAGYDQIIAVDLTKPELDIPVVKVVIPGLAVPNSLLGKFKVREGSSPLRSAAA